jgi:hypothetical protein
MPGGWVQKAFFDYASARCLLLHGLPGGFILAQQAVEKLLKAYLKIAYPDRNTFVGKRGLIPGEIGVCDSHDLVAHARLVDSYFLELHLNLLREYYWLFELLSYLFDGKYPDSKTPTSPSDTRWLSDFDKLAVHLSFHLPIDEPDRWRAGVFHAAWPLVLDNQPDPPWSKWVREQNLSFFESFNEIRTIILEGHSSSYPSKSS